MEKESGRREDVLRQEISDLQQVLKHCLHSLNVYRLAIKQY